MNTLGYRLLELLKAKDMTQKELAYTIGVSEVSISRYVNNARKPRTMVLYKMAEVLGVSAEYLLTGNKKEEYGKWIPVSERLPKDEKNCLVTLKKTEGIPETLMSIANYLVFPDGGHWNDIKHGFLGWDRYKNGSAGTMMYKVVAWLPLPEPYKE